MQPLTVDFGTGQWKVTVDGAPVLDSTTNKPATTLTGKWSGFVKDSITFARADSPESRGESPGDVEKIRHEARARDPGTIQPTPGAAPGRPYGEEELDPAGEQKRRQLQPGEAERREREKREQERATTTPAGPRAVPPSERK